MDERLRLMDGDLRLMDGDLRLMDEHLRLMDEHLRLVIDALIVGYKGPSTGRHFKAQLCSDRTLRLPARRGTGDVPGPERPGYGRAKAACAA
jgi:hypothetical protein